MEYCAVCGRPSECTHHLIGGFGKRDISEAYDLKIRLCNEHHNMAVKPESRIHGNPMAEKLSKMLGQMQFERDFLARKMFVSDGYIPEEVLHEARTEFIEIFSRSYL